MCRTSPSRNCPVTRGSGPPKALAREQTPSRRPCAARRWPRCRRRHRRGCHLLDAEQVGRGDVADVDEVPQLAAVLVHPRRLAPLEGRADDGRHAGVGRVARHPRSVDVVVAQRDRRAAGGADPGGRELLLADLGDGVGVARVERSVSTTRSSTRSAPHVGHSGSNRPASRSSDRPRQGWHASVGGAAVAALAVDHHRGGLDQPVTAAPGHGGQQHRRTRGCCARCSRAGPGCRRRGRPSPPGGRRRRRRRGRRRPSRVAHVAEDELGPIGRGRPGPWRRPVGQREQQIQDPTW